jgi:hypothetical protein
MATTLVIDTIGLNDRTFLDFFRTPYSPDLHLIERWKLVDDGTLEVKVRVEDSGAFKARLMRSHSAFAGPIGRG